MNQASTAGSPTVGVAIPTYNRDDLLETCLEHVAYQTLRPARIIIIDNGTRNIMPEFLRKFEPLEWIPLHSNRGTSVAFNLGIGAAKRCEYVFLLNNDVDMEPECLSRLVQALEQDSSYSAAVPKLLRWSDPRYLDGVGDEILLGGGAYRVGNGELDAGQYDQSGPVFSACAAAALYRTSLFEDIGGFDEEFFAYREDVDLGLRAQLRGHRCLYVPAARAHHRGGATMGTFHPNTDDRQGLPVIVDLEVGAAFNCLPTILVGVRDSKTRIRRVLPRFAGRDFTRSKHARKEKGNSTEATCGYRVPSVYNESV